ncbi:MULTISPECIES: TIGR04104 family putative zinc finger protein [Bacillaceae]|uniref:Cxxc_20_cxxc protein n=1 Tax=Evansella alkalicola TaxID=745819 RepID=A0ABS6JPT7_9BACI|nr:MULTISPECIES: TIGR04104 family putative zinc finger protein [Bacillaceae]MBU9720277.1 hypothetical protein [Bacillus alkalicola]
MKQCKNCSTGFNYIDMLKSVWFKNKNAQCSNCAYSYTITVDSKFITTALIIVPAALFMAISTMGSFLLKASFGLIIAIIASLFAPILSNFEEE